MKPAFFVVLLDVNNMPYQSKHVIWGGPYDTMDIARSQIDDRHPPRTFLIVEAVHQVKTRNLTLTEDTSLKESAA